MSKELRSIRPLSQDSLRGVEPGKVGKKLPKFEWVDPRKLFVEERYQRAIMENGTALIRRIYSRFSWARFKPPICVRLRDSGNVLVCIDGQHTATACASHPGIDKIPVMIVEAADVKDRAAAFVGHNKDRIGLTTVMIYAAELAAGDELAVAIDKACRAAGASIPRRAISTTQRDKHPIGTTGSIGTIRAIAKRQGVEALTRVLRVLVAAKRGPIKSVEIAAVALIFSVHPAAVDGKLRALIVTKTAEEWTLLGQIAAAEQGKALAIAVAQIWCRALGIEPPDSDLRGNASDHARLIVAKPNSSETPVPAAQVKPEAEPAPPPQAVGDPADGKPAGERYVERNGIRFDLVARTILHRGLEDSLDAEGLRMVAALARVMPAFLPAEVIAKAAFGNAVAAELKVKLLAERANRTLAGLRLAAREVPKMGWMLADLDA